MDEKAIPGPGETVFDLGFGGLRIIQACDRTRFGVDAVLLAHFGCPCPGERVVDLGAGSGIVALLMAGRQPDCVIDALELRPDPAGRAARSVAMNGLGGRIRALEGDLRLEPRLLAAGAYDRAVCNPPYYRVGEGKLSPRADVAAARHEVSCTLADVMKAAAALLRPGGRFCAVYPARRQDEFMDTLPRYGLRPVRVRPVLHREGCPPVLALVEAVRGEWGNPILEEPPLVQYGGDGRFTAEMRHIYHMEPYAER